MPIETKDLLSYLGVDADDLDKFKATFQDKFVPKDQVPDEDTIKANTVGKVTGAFRTKAKQLFELDSEELNKTTKWEEILELGVAKQKKQIEDLKISSTATNDTQLKELTDKLERANQTARDYKDANELIKTTMSDKEAEWSTKIKQTKASFVKTNALASFAPKLSDSLTKGDKFLLENEINNLQIDFDEQDQIVVKDKDGKRIPNPKRIGEFLGLEESIELIAEKEGFIKKNAATPQRQITAVNTQPNPAQQQGQRQVHPNAIAASQKAKV